MLDVSDILIYTNPSSALSGTLTLPLDIYMIEAPFFDLLNNKADY